MRPGPEDIAEALAALEGAHRRRTRRVIESPQGARVREGGFELANFAGNDYLGLANDPRLKTAAYSAIDEFGVGSGASPLVVGHMRVHEEAEKRFADFVGLPRALLFASGYAANLGILATLGERDADIFGDRLNHACLNDGAILSRAELEDRIYGWNEEVESNAVEFLIHSLRKKLGATAIKNVRGVGWMVSKES